MTHRPASSDTDAPVTGKPEPDLDRDLAHRIRDLRRALNMTARELDDLTGQGTGTTGRLERGEQRVYAAHLYRIAQATGVDIEWFCRDESVTLSPTADYEGDHHGRRLLDAYLRIEDPGVRRDVYDLIAHLAKNA